MEIRIESAPSGSATTTIAPISDELYLKIVLLTQLERALAAAADPIARDRDSELDATYDLLVHALYIQYRYRVGAHIGVVGNASMIPTQWL